MQLLWQQTLTGFSVLDMIGFTHFSILLFICNFSILDSDSVPVLPSECHSGFQSDVVFVLGSTSQNPSGAFKALGMVKEVIADKNTFVG